MKLIISSRIWSLPPLKNSPLRLSFVPVPTRYLSFSTLLVITFLGLFSRRFLQLTLQEKKARSKTIDFHLTHLLTKGYTSRACAIQILRVLSHSKPSRSYCWAIPGDEWIFSRSCLSWKHGAPRSLAAGISKAHPTSPLP